MKIYMYKYERVNTFYRNHKLIIFAESQEEADKKAKSFIVENNEKDKSYAVKHNVESRPFQITESFGEICGLRFEEGFEDSFYVYGIKQKEMDEK